MTTQQLNQLNSNGWIELDYITNDETLFELSKSIGQILKHPNGNAIDYLKPKFKKDAVKNTFSYNFEYENFPFHTDTAFWNIPARYVLLSCEGSSKTATTFVTYREIYKTLTHKEFDEMKKSIFLVKTANKNFYSSFINTYENKILIRLDTNCMKPMNNSAKRALELINKKLNNSQINKIEWNKPKVFIFDNWRILHGRESINLGESRILKRIYIKQL